VNHLLKQVQIHYKFLPSSNLSYGIIFLDEPITPLLVIGTVLLLVSLALVNYEKKDSSQPVTLKWIIFVSLAFIGNGMCTVVQKVKQETFDNAGNNMFMIVGLAMAVVIMLVLAFTSKEERPDMGKVVKQGWLWALLCGGANGLTNFLVIFLNNRLSASVMFPVISGGGMVLIFLYSVIFARERFKPRQIVGFFLGIASIVILNL
jgi:drug/metabolite transporter (DMT)-like permease